MGGVKNRREHVAVGKSDFRRPPLVTHTPAPQAEATHAEKSCTGRGHRSAVNGQGFARAA